MTRANVTAKILAAKVAKNISWATAAKKIAGAKGSKEFVTTCLLGQMAMTRTEAAAAAKLFDLTPDEAKWLTKPPYRGGLRESVPTDPLLYRFYEITQVFGPAMKELIEEEFGDGIMSAIDFSVDIKRKKDPKGDRVVVTLNGKFLPYKRF